MLIMTNKSLTYVFTTFLLSFYFPAILYLYLCVRDNYSKELSKVKSQRLCLKNSFYERLFLLVIEDFLYFMISKLQFPTIKTSGSKSPLYQVFHAHLSMAVCIVSFILSLTTTRMTVFVYQDEVLKAC